MVRFVVKHEDVFDVHEIGHHPLNHLSLGFEGEQFLAAPSFQRGPRAFRYVDALAKFESVIVGDDDFRASYLVHHVAWHEVALGVIAFGIVRLQDAQAVFDGEAGGDDEEAVREPLAVLVSRGVDRLPSDQHGHDGRLSGPSGQFQGEPKQFGIGVVVGPYQMVEKSPARLRFGSDLGHPDRGFDGLYLTEKGPYAAELVMPPVLEQAGRFRRDLPLVGVGPGPPPRHLASNLIDERGRVVLLFLGGEPFAFVEDDRLLRGGPLAFLRFGDGRDELRTAASLDDPLSRLAVIIEFPMAVGILVGRV